VEDAISMVLTSTPEQRRRALEALTAIKNAEAASKFVAQYDALKG
jgi:hypothetical protein